MRLIWRDWNSRFCAEMIPACLGVNENLYQGYHNSFFFFLQKMSWNTIMTCKKTPIAFLYYFTKALRISLLISTTVPIQSWNPFQSKARIEWRHCHRHRHVQVPGTMVQVLGPPCHSYRTASHGMDTWIYSHSKSKYFEVVEYHHNTTETWVSKSFE